MSLSIRVACRSCAREVNSSECDSKLRCSLCVALSLCADDLREYERLWRKRDRYGRAGAPQSGPEDQLGRLAKRMSRRLHERISDGQLAAQILNQALEQAQQRAISSRILVRA